MNISERLDGLWDVEWAHSLDSFRVSRPTPSPSPPIVFIGESPHTDEVKSGDTPETRYPLAGRSGKSVTAALGDLESDDQACRPLGELVARGVVDWLTIINVCEVPLDPGTYALLVAKGDVAVDPTRSPSLEAWLKLTYSFQLIKDGAAGHRQNCFANEVDQRVKADFKRRVGDAVGDSTRFVVLLGDTAKGYYELMCADLNVGVRCAPHPSPSASAGGWEIDLATRSAIHEVKQLATPSD